MTATHHTPDLFALSEIHGPVLRPGDDAYVAEVTGFNLAAIHRPDIVVGARDTDDIVTAMRWAAPPAPPSPSRPPATARTSRSTADCSSAPPA